MKHSVLRVLMNWFIMILFLLSCSGFSFVVYLIRDLRLSIPSRGMNEPPHTHFNEGEASCFDINSMWYTLKHSDYIMTEDALWMGGTDPKHILVHNTLADLSPLGISFRSMWKPQLPYRFKKPMHTASAQNEVIAFHMDCLLNLRRTPPATVAAVDTFELLRSMNPNNFSIYKHRKAPFNQWESEEVAWGTSQVFWPNVRTLNPIAEYTIRFCKTIGFYGYFSTMLGATSTTTRELSQRDMLDYIIGNWDRGHNQFVVYDEERGTNEIIYLDHNHLRTNRAGKKAFSLKLCKFWNHTILKLRDLVAQDVSILLRESLKKHESNEFLWDEKHTLPVTHAQKRAQDFLDHVDHCVAKHGEDYVFHT